VALVYFDSTAFVKLLVEQDGSDLAAALWDGCDAAVSSRLAYPEVRAALAAAGRAERLDAADQRRAEAA
jgi:predicted nucleic acid-binding protein